MTQRRLTAILSADVVGYSRLMGDDEAGTLAALKTHRETLFDPEVAQRGGRIAKLMGDGVLVEFPSVVNAVDAALAVQRALDEDPGPIQLRIGINLGDIIVDGDEIYGDGVNVAARLEAEAEPGGICIASTVHESIRNRVDADFRDAGDIALKNIDHPVHVFQWMPKMAPATVKPQPATTQIGKPGKSRTVALVSLASLLIAVAVAVAGVQMMRVSGETTKAAAPVVAPSTEEPVVAAADASKSEIAVPGETETPAPESKTDDTAPDATEAIAATPPAEPVNPTTETSTAPAPATDATDPIVPTVPQEPETSEPVPVPSGEIAGLLEGKVLRGGNEFGGKRFALQMRANGTFRGEISFDDAFGSAGVDNGRWSVRDDALCVRFLEFSAGRQVCANVMRAGDVVSFKTANGTDRKWTLE